MSNSTPNPNKIVPLTVKELSNNITAQIDKCAASARLNIQNKSIDSQSESKITFTSNITYNTIALNSELAPMACPMDIVLEGTLPTCVGDSNAELRVNISNGTPPYSVSWPDGFTGTRRNDLAAGEYTITISDPQPCVVESTFEILEPDPLVIDASSTFVSCDSIDNGTISIEPKGGTTYDEVRS